MSKDNSELEEAQSEVFDLEDKVDDLEEELKEARSRALDAEKLYPALGIGQVGRDLIACSGDPERALLSELSRARS